MSKRPIDDKEEELVMDVDTDKKMEDMVNRAAIAAATMTTQKSDEAWEKRLSTLFQQHEEKQDLKMQVMEKRLKEEMEALEKRLKSSASSAASVVSVGSTMASTRMSGARQIHSPSKIDVKGFVKDWKNRTSEGLTQPELQRWMKQVYEAMDEDEKKMLDIEMTEKINNRVINGVATFKLTTEAIEGRQAWKLKKAIEAAIASKNLSMGKDLRVVVEPPAWKAPYLKAGGKALGLLKEKGAERLKPEWTVPMRIYYQPENERPELLMEYSEAAGWTIMGDCLEKACPGENPDNLKAELSAVRP